MFREAWGKMKLNEPGRRWVELEVLSAGERCKALFWPTPGIKQKEPLISLGSPPGGTLISVSSDLFCFVLTWRILVTHWNINTTWLPASELGHGEDDTVRQVSDSMRSLWPVWLCLGPLSGITSLTTKPGFRRPKQHTSGKVWFLLSVTSLSLRQVLWRGHERRFRPVETEVTMETRVTLSSHDGFQWITSKIRNPSCVAQVLQTRIQNVITFSSPLLGRLIQVNSLSEKYMEAYYRININNV